MKNFFFQHPKAPPFGFSKTVFAVQGGNFSKKKILRFWKSLKYVKEWPEDVGPSQFWHNPFIRLGYFYHGSLRWRTTATAVIINMMNISKIILKFWQLPRPLTPSWPHPCPLATSWPTATPPGHLLAVDLIILWPAYLVTLAENSDLERIKPNHVLEHLSMDENSW